MRTPPRLELPPRSLLLGTALVAVATAIPYLAARLAVPPPGTLYVPAPLAVRDWLAYVALTEQPWSAGEIFLSNPFTTDPQSGRFLLLPLQILNALHHATGLSGFILLELARLPLLFSFVVALWSFLGRILPDARERRWAAWLVLLSGGWEILPYALRDHFPPAVAESIHANLWHMFGWNTFAAGRNPLWLAGFTLVLAALTRAIAPGPARWRPAAAAGAAVVLAWCTHPYSAVATGVMIAGAFTLEALLAGRAAFRGRMPLLVCLGAAAVLVAALAAWQRADPVFRESSGSFFGSKEASPFWYPLTYGALFPLAILGLRRWTIEQRPWRFALAGATSAIVMFSSSDLVNGYHFVPYLHVFVCALAAPALVSSLDRWCARRGGVVLRAALLISLFASAPAVVAAGIADREDALVPADALAAIERLGTLPPGNVLAPPWMGNVVPAYAPQRVHVGHYFMTPRYKERRDRVERILGDPRAHEADLQRLLAEAHIDYMLLPRNRASEAAAALGPAFGGGTGVGTWAILLVRRGAPEGAITPAPAELSPGRTP